MPRSFRSLKKGAVRADWNKHTLFSLSRLSYAPERRHTFFQQKWKAKSLLRAYHHPDVREKKWQRMFDRRLPAVVPMSPASLAQSDGREFSAGRGSGLIMEDGGRFKEELGGSTEVRPRTPYMQMTFFPLEKRLDTAIFRAMFASSIRQARSMILHGGVTVNGKKMIHPGYLLNPGDMFQVEPDRVMYATGAPKRGQRKKAAASTEGEENQEDSEAVKEEVEEEPAAVPETSVEEISTESEVKATEAAETLSDMTPDRKRLAAMRQIIAQVLDRGKGGALSAKVAIQLRKIRDTVVSALQDDADDEKLAETVAEIHADLVRVARDVPLTFIPTEARNILKPKSRNETPELDQDDIDRLTQALLEKEKENPYDPTKPYRTPWQPRKYMSAFAFIPRYLEVNQNICAAVYLRHPVARPGLAEIPTPFHPNTAQLAFNWYLRRR